MCDYKGFLDFQMLPENHSDPSRTILVENNCNNSFYLIDYLPKLDCKAR